LKFSATVGLKIPRFMMIWCNKHLTCRFSNGKTKPGLPPPDNEKENAALTSDPLETAQCWLADGRRIALATVIETWGSAPRPVGSHLVIDAEGNFEGSVSGGCVEGAVVFEAVEAIDTGKPKILEFGVADETAWEVGLSCGGRIRVYVEPVGETN